MLFDADIIQRSFHYLKPRQSINPRALIVYFRQFATLVNAGVPLLKSCDILAASQTNKQLITITLSIKKHIAAGHQLCESFKDFADIFDELTYEMIFIGEQTGRLDYLLEKIAIHHENQYASRQKIKQALIYPSFVIITALCVTLAMLVFVVPKFALLFQSAYQKLPLFTRFVFQFSQFLNEYLLYLSSSFVLAMIILNRVAKHYQRRLSQIVFQLPFIHHCYQKLILTRFCRQLVLSLSSGIPIINALNLLTNLCRDRRFSPIFLDISAEVYAGRALSQALSKHVRFFPSLMIQMIKIGEETGALELMLTKIADLYDADIDQFSQTISQTLEPLIIVILGALIGGLVIAMYLPIFKLGTIL